MEAIALNASPRKNGKTATILAAVLEGAHSRGARTDLVHLIDLDMGGCRGCRHCDTNPGICALKDGLTPYMKKILESDVIIIGTPVYIFRESSLCKALIERFFCYVDVEIDFENADQNISSHFPSGKKFCYVVTQGFPNADMHKNVLDYLKLTCSFISGQECEGLHYVGAAGGSSAEHDSAFLGRAKQFGKKLVAS